MSDWHLHHLLFRHALVSLMFLAITINRPSLMIQTHTLGIGWWMLMGSSIPRFLFENSDIEKTWKNIDIYILIFHVLSPDFTGRTRRNCWRTTTSKWWSGIEKIPRRETTTCPRHWNRRTRDKDETLKPAELTEPSEPSETQRPSTCKLRITEIQNETKNDKDRWLIYFFAVSNVPFWNGWAFNVVVQKANVVRRKRKFCRVVRVLLMLTWWIQFILDIIGLHENSHV